MKINPSQENLLNPSIDKRKEDTMIVIDSSKRSKKKTMASKSSTKASLHKQSKKPKIFIDLLKEIGKSKQHHDRKVLMQKKNGRSKIFNY